MSNEYFDPFEVETEGVPSWVDENQNAPIRVRKPKAADDPNRDPDICGTCKKPLPEDRHGLQRYCDSECQNKRPSRKAQVRKSARDYYRRKMAAQGHIVTPRDQIIPKTKEYWAAYQRKRYAAKQAEKGKTVHKRVIRTPEEVRKLERERYARRMLKQGKVVKPRRGIDD